MGDKDYEQGNPFDFRYPCRHAPMSHSSSVILILILIKGSICLKKGSTLQTQRKYERALFSAKFTLCIHFSLFIFHRIHLHLHLHLHLLCLSSIVLPFTHAQ